MPVTPVSWAMTCCVRSASSAASAVGSASASSSALVCSDCVPPRTAAIACSAVRTTLLRGCCAVNDTPAVWLWKRSCHDRGSRAPNRSRMTRAQIRLAARYLAISSKKSLCALKKNDSRGANWSTSRPASTPVLHVLDAVAERERQLLRGGRPGLADVVAADRDAVPPRHLGGAEREDVGHQPHRRPRRVDEFLLGDELLEDVVLQRPRQRAPVGALLLGDDQVHREDHRRRRVDRHRRGDRRQVDAVEQRLHVLERGDADAALADLAERQRIVGIAPHQRRQVEGDAETGAARRQQLLVARVGLLRRPVAGELPHRPQAAAVAVAVNAARVRKGAGVGEIARVVDGRDAVRRVQLVDRSAGDRCEPRPHAGSI